jgi:integrase
MATIELAYVQEFCDRHDKVRRYFRRAGCKRVALPGLPNSAEFMAAYQAALAAPPVPIGASRTIAGTVHALVKAYLDTTPGSSSPFKTLAAETQRTRRNILENFAAADGEKRIFQIAPNGRKIMLLHREHVQRMVNAKVATPFAQRNFLKTLHAMFDWAVGEGRVPEDPTIGVKWCKARSTGHKTWTAAEIDRFEAMHPIGSMARLALALFLYSGARKSDVVAMGPQNIHNGVLTFTQRKVRGRETEKVEVPVHPRLAEAIAATPTGLRTFLVTSFGKPFTANGFGNKMREWCNTAGCPDVSAHGLRKAMASRLADHGASDHEIMAVTGHASTSELAKYTKAANRRRMAREAMARLIEDDEA